MKGKIFQGDFARIGKWQEWYENGILKREYFFDENQPNAKTGIWKWWDEKGNLIKEETYKDDVLIDKKEYVKSTQPK